MSFTRPPAFQQGAEASFAYWFGINRFLHFAASYIFLFNFIFRLYWGFRRQPLCRLEELHPHQPEILPGNVGGDQDRYLLQRTKNTSPLCIMPW